MKYCVDCGQQIPDNARFCPFCAADQGVTAQGPPVLQPPAPPAPIVQAAPPPAPVQKSHTARNVAIGLLIAFLFIGAVGGAFNLGVMQGQSSQSKAVTTTVTSISTTGAQMQIEGMQPWNGYGITVQVPAGVTAQYGPMNTTSGQISWSWNGNQTGLILQWWAVTAYNLTAGFAGLHQRLVGNFASSALTGKGNVSMSGHQWAYETYAVVNQGNPNQYYISFALSFYPASGRAYGLAFADMIPNTLVSLQVYGGTFQG